MRLFAGSIPMELALTVDLEGIREAIDGWLVEGVAAIKQHIVTALTKIGRDPDPYDGLRILMGGRFGMHPSFADKLAKELPSNVQIHRFKEPDRTNLAAPTVKTATALGLLSTKFDKIGLGQRTEQRNAFRYRVGKARHGQFMDVIGPTNSYDEWREMGACTKTDVEVLFMIATDDGDVAADDPRVMRAQATVDPGAVGKRLYLRAVGPTRVDLSYAPMGDEPTKSAPRWAFDLLGGDRREGLRRLARAGSQDSDAGPARVRGTARGHQRAKGGAGWRGVARPFTSEAGSLRGRGATPSRAWPAGGQLSVFLRVR